MDVRTGDTPQPARRSQLKHPADILVTTPESLFLLLASQARETLRSVHTVIVAEVHALAPVKRGAHLYRALTQPLLDHVLDMLSGHYPAGDFADLRPLLAWDRARPHRVPGAWVALVDGCLALYLQPGGRSLLTFPGEMAEPEAQLASAFRSLADLPAGGRRHYPIVKVDGLAALDTPWHALMRKNGFVSDHQGLSPGR